MSIQSDGWFDAMESQMERLRGRYGSVMGNHGVTLTERAFWEKYRDVTKYGRPVDCVYRRVLRWRMTLFVYSCLLAKKGKLANDPTGETNLARLEKLLADRPPSRLSLL